MVADSKTLVPHGIEIAFWVIFSLEVAAYAFGWVREAFPSRTRPGVETPEEMEEKASI